MRANHLHRAAALSVVGLAIGLGGCALALDYDEVAFEREGTQAAVGAAGAAGAANPEPATEPPDDACAGVSCGAHGSCAVVEGNPLCECEPGFHAEGTICIQDAPLDPCEGVTCGGYASCQAGACVCDQGYEGDPYAGCTTPLTVEQQVRGEVMAIAAAELGYCEGVDNRPYMAWQPGYWCYDFVAWVYDRVGYPLPSPGALNEYWVGNLPQGWIPEPGDLIKFKIQHYGIVAEVYPDGSIRTIEGNYNSCVESRVITLASIRYFGSLDGAF